MIYGDAAGFEAYHTGRGRVIPGTWDEDSINAALLVASEWIDGIYGPSFVGHKTDGFTQEREWPRVNAVVRSTGYWGDYYVFPDSVIPQQVEKAAYEAAFRQATTPGSLQVDYTPGKYRSVTIQGAISVDYAQFSMSSEVQIQIAAVDTWLWPLLDCSTPGSMSGASGGSSRV